MKTLYKNSRLIAAAIVGTLVFSVGAAVAMTKDAPCNLRVVSQTVSQEQDMGRFVVTPKTMTFVRPAEVIGRFVVSQHTAVFIPAA